MESGSQNAAGYARPGIHQGVPQQVEEADHTGTKHRSVDSIFCIDFGKVTAIPGGIAGKAGDH